MDLEKGKEAEQMMVGGGNKSEVYLLRRQAVLGVK